MVDSKADVLGEISTCGGFARLTMPDANQEKNDVLGTKRETKESSIDCILYRSSGEFKSHPDQLNSLLLTTPFYIYLEKEKPS